jgi:hypothetical protein
MRRSCSTTLLIWAVQLISLSISSVRQVSYYVRPISQRVFALMSENIRGDEISRTAQPLRGGNDLIQYSATLVRGCAGIS